MTTAATIEPEKVIAGDSWRWTISLADYPAPAWTLSYRLVREHNSYTFDAEADGSDHLVNRTPAETEEIEDGDYQWFAWVSDGTDRHTVRQGQITVEPDPARQEAGFDRRSYNQQMLDAINAVLLKKASKDVMSYTIAGRQLQHYGFDELRQLQKDYEAKVAREREGTRLAQGKPATGRHVIQRIVPSP